MGGWLWGQAPSAPPQAPAATAVQAAAPVKAAPAGDPARRVAAANAIKNLRMSRPPRLDLHQRCIMAKLMQHEAFGRRDLCAPGSLL